jgi:hypothetical protein
MSITDPDGNPELANIGNALDGTLNISTEDVKEVPSEDEATAGAKEKFFRKIDTHILTILCFFTF